MMNRQIDTSYLDFSEQQALRRKAEVLRAEEAARVLTDLKDFVANYFTAKSDGFRPAVRGIHHTAI